MENRYFCPECKSDLLVDGHIILTAEAKSGKGLLLFEPKLGNYNFRKHANFLLETGEHVEFYCPVCRKNLSEKDDSLAQICLQDSEGDVYELWFSELVGKEATYKIKAGVIEAFGKDNQIYLNHFGHEPTY